MNAHAKIEAVTMRTAFPPHQVSKLPKETRAQIDARKANKDLTVWKCKECGGAHHKDAVHLDYVGHAAITDRLLDVDPEWHWEPLAYGPDGLPALDRNGGLWIRLTVLGVTRLGYGGADGKQGTDAIKEIIGDALRNAAMRFGTALDLWHKGELHLEADTENTAASQTGAINDEQLVRLQSLIQATSSNVKAFCQRLKIDTLPDLPADRFGEALELLETKLANMAKAETAAKAKESA